MRRKKDSTDGTVVVPAEVVETKKTRIGEYIVFKEADNGTDFSKVAEGPSLRACVKAITDGKLVGKFLIVCVRRRLVSAVEETLKLT